MPTPLTTLQNVQRILDLSQLDPASTALVSLYITEASSAICNWCRVKDFGLYTVTEPLSGANTPSLTVRQIPVQGTTVNNLAATANSSTLTGFPTTASQANLFVGQSLFSPAFNVPVAVASITAPSLTLSNPATATAAGVYLTDSTAGVNVTGNTTSGGTTVTNLSSVTGLTVGDTITGAGIPAATTVTAVTTGSLSVMGSAGTTATAATTTTGPVSFGVAVYADNNAFGGTAPGAFAPSTVLCEGGDYYLDWDDVPGGTCSSGILYRMGYYWFRPSIWFAGLITPQDGPPILNYKVTYLAGYSSVPSAVQAACEMLIAGMRASRKFGQTPTNLGNADMNVALTQEEVFGLFTAPIRTLLAPYRKVAFTGS